MLQHSMLLQHPHPEHILNQVSFMSLFIRHLNILLENTLQNTMTRAVDFNLSFTVELINRIVEYTNADTYTHITKGWNMSYVQQDDSGKEVTNQGDHYQS